MVQKRETKAINKLCVREILSLSFVCGAYFFEFRSRNLVCFVIAYNFNGKYAPEAGKTRMRTAFFTRVSGYEFKLVNNPSSSIIIIDNNYGIYIAPYTLAALWRFTILQLRILCHVIVWLNFGKLANFRSIDQ